MELQSDKPFERLPSVLALRRCVINTDAALQYLDQNGTAYPVRVFHLGIRGTQNQSATKTKKGETVHDAKVFEVANLQDGEVARTGADMQAITAQFSLRFTPLSQGIEACTDDGDADIKLMRKFLKDFIERACGEESEGVEEVSRRIARNVCNGRWLWRNRDVAQTMSITISDQDSGDVIARVDDALGVPSMSFDNYSQPELTVAARIADGLCGRSKSAVSVKAEFTMGVKGSTEVFCSQNYIVDTRKPRPEDKAGRSLYKLPIALSEADRDANVVGQAAYRDAKVWNALRTFDTWYPGFAEIETPIPIEPLGASLEHAIHFRPHAGKQTFFDYLKHINTIDARSPKGMFCIGCLIRGGVFGEKAPDAKKRKNQAPKAEGEDAGDAGDDDTGDAADATASAPVADLFR